MARKSLWLLYEGLRLREAGCTVTMTTVRLTGDCLDRFDPPGGMYQPFPKDYLKGGRRYEIRILFSMSLADYDPYQAFSNIQSVTIPKPPKPTPTARPTPTATPPPTSSPPAPEREQVADVRDLFKNNAILVSAWEYDNHAKSWKAYVRDREPKTLTSFRAGRAYWILVSDSGTVAGHSLYFDKEFGGWNMVAW